MMMVNEFTVHSYHYNSSMKIHTHHIKYRSQGGTDDLSNLIDIDFIEHAELHAIDFINGGPMFDFRHEGWRYLSPELRQAVLDEHTKRNKLRSGPNHPSHGKVWYNNGAKNLLLDQDEEPPYGYYKGKLDNGDRRGSNNPCHGRLWYTNGTKNLRLYPHDDVPEGYYQGRAGVPKRSQELKDRESINKRGDKNPCHGKRWYTDGNDSQYLSKDDPIPEGYYRGRTLKK